MSFNLFSQSSRKEESNIASPLARAKDFPQDFYANEKSFLSDFNIEEEIFGGMSSGSVHGADGSILPMSIPYNQGC
jgi:hypothetical protein